MDGDKLMSGISLQRCNSVVESSLRISAARFRHFDHARYMNPLC